MAARDRCGTRFMTAISAVSLTTHITVSKNYDDDYTGPSYGSGQLDLAQSVSIVHFLVHVIGIGA